MLDFVESAAFPSVGPTFSPEAIDGFHVGAPDESDVGGSDGPESIWFQTALERGPDQAFEITAEQLDEEGLVQQGVRFTAVERCRQMRGPTGRGRHHDTSPAAKAPHAAVADETDVRTNRNSPRCPLRGIDAEELGPEPISTAPHVTSGDLATR